MTLATLKLVLASTTCSSLWISDIMFSLSDKGKTRFRRSRFRRKKVNQDLTALIVAGMQRGRTTTDLISTLPGRCSERGGPDLPGRGVRFWHRSAWYSHAQFPM